MKLTKKVVCALALSALAGNLAVADENAVPKAKSPDAAPPKKVTAAHPAPKAKPILLTGSRIPTRADGLVVNSSSPVVVIDNDAIRRSGARDLADLLRRGGYNR